MIRGPLFAEPRGRGWYIADAEMREVSCALYISKRAAVAAIRAMAAPAEVGHPLFYTVKKFGKASIPGCARIRRTVFPAEASHAIGPRFQL